MKQQEHEIGTIYNNKSPVILFYLCALIILKTYEQIKAINEATKNLNNSLTQIIKVEILKRTQTFKHFLGPNLYNLHDIKKN